MPPDLRPDVDVMFGGLLRAGENDARLRAALAGCSLDSPAMISLLRRAVPIRFLELVSSTNPFSDDARILAAVVLNPRVPRHLALRLVPSLFWRDLADVAVGPRVAGAVRVRAEGVLKERVPEMRVGERVTLGKIATPAVLPILLADPEAKVIRACLQNPRLREEDLVTAVRQEMAPRALLEGAPESWRWRDSYAVRLALVLQPRTPLGVSLAQISSLLPADLVRVSEAQGIPPLVQITAQRMAGREPS
ncbi:MAG: hypothetical protein DMF82_06480 [Acidobacteria bacterium]|nr:MAG: hypothetical protein DMF82_06480 [Acidobacteriota bacterium]